jgi:hypothetical protein
MSLSLRSAVLALMLAGSMAPTRLLAADDASAPTITPQQQQCLTWLSLAARFATSEEQRIAFDQQYLRLNRAVAGGTDQVPAADAAEVHSTSPEYDKWVMDQDLADEATKARMLDELTQKAAACAPLVPAQPQPSTPVQ